MARRLPHPPSLRRSQNTTSPKVELFISCEGENTEPKYFENCVSHYGAGLVKLTILPKTGVPLTVVRAAIIERERLLSERRSSRDSFDSCFRVWAVFDCDEHPKISEAMELAAKHRVDVAFSNPCFELWPLLHLEDYGAQDGRQSLQSRLAQLMPSYKHDQEALVDFDQIKDEVMVAVERARKHVRARDLEACPLGNPSTTVGELVLKIIQNGKRRPP